MEKEKDKLAELEESLGKEEKVLEGIRDSLKGKNISPGYVISLANARPANTDKTQVFHDQIEVKQKELQPWTAQINAKQAEIDIAISERDSLAKKAEAVQSTRKEAQETLERLQTDLAAKVRQTSRLLIIINNSITGS